jgi:hypothetical protein
LGIRTEIPANESEKVKSSSDWSTLNSTVDSLLSEFWLHEKTKAIRQMYTILHLNIAHRIPVQRKYKVTGLKINCATSTIRGQLVE